MKLVLISAYALGYYSDSEYEESLIVTKDGYDLVFGEDSYTSHGIELYISELDGKHSETQADVEVSEISDNEITEEQKEVDTWGNLYSKVEEKFNEEGVDLEANTKIVQDYLKDLDLMVRFEVQIQQSQKQRVLDFVEELKEGEFTRER